jgi:preprotein translocase subunit SecE
VAISARRRAQADQAPGVIRFLRETFDELRKVVWPTPQELYRYTLVVVVTVTVIAVFIAAVDLGLQQLSTHFIYTSGNTG